MRRAAKIDANQRVIVKALRFIGASVFVTSHVGDGFPDLVVGYRGQNYLIEVKTRKGLMTTEQLEFASRWRGQYHVCRDLADVAELLNIDETILKYATGSTR